MSPQVFFSAGSISTLPGRVQGSSLVVTYSRFPVSLSEAPALFCHRGGRVLLRGGAAAAGRVLLRSALNAQSINESFGLMLGLMNVQLWLVGVGCPAKAFLNAATAAWEKFFHSSVSIERSSASTTRLAPAAAKDHNHSCSNTGIPASWAGTERNGTEFRGIPLPFRSGIPTSC